MTRPTRDAAQLRPSARGRPPTYHHGDLRNALLTAAGRMLAEQGVEGLSLRELSQRAGVSHTAAYRHYADKQALLADIAEQGFAGLQQAHDAAVEALRSPLEKLAASGRAYVEFGRRHPQLLQLMFGSAIEPWDRHPRLVAAGRQLAGSLRGLVEQGQAAGELRAGNAQELALAAWSRVHGLALLVAGRRIPGLRDQSGEIERLGAACIDCLISGLRHPAPLQAPAKPEPRSRNPVAMRKRRQTDPP